MINSTGDVSDHMNATGDATPSETAGFVPDGSVPGKIKKPRRLEELAFSSCMKAPNPICMQGLSLHCS